MTDTQDRDSYPTQPLPLQGQASQSVDLGEEEVVTPLPQAHVPMVFDAASGRPSGQRPSAFLWVLVGLSLVLSLASLALSLAIVNSLSNAQRVAVQGLDSAISALDDLQGEGFHYEYRFEKTIPVSSSIPIQQEMVIPFSGDFPINTVVQVPIDAGILGTFTVDVPINTSVHVDTEVPISVDQTFDIDTTIPVSMVIPIDVRPEDPEVQNSLSGLRAWLMDLRESLDTGLHLSLPGD